MGMDRLLSGLRHQQDQEMTNIWHSRTGLVTASLIVACLVVGWLAHGLVVQPADAPVVTGFDSWRLICPKRAQAGQACELDQNVVDYKSGATMVRFAISGNEAMPTVDISVPFNVLLPAGLGLRLNDEPMKAYPYRTCNATGCIATITADSKLYRAVVGAKRIRVFFANLNGKAVGYELSLNSFGKAVSAMKDAEAKRHSWLRRVLL